MSQLRAQDGEMPTLRVDDRTVPDLPHVLPVSATAPVGARAGTSIPLRVPRPVRHPRGSRLVARWRPTRGGGDEILDVTRRLFVALALISLPLSLLGPVTTDRGLPLVGALAGGVALGLSWALGYRRRRVLVQMDLVDALAIVAIGVANPDPEPVVALVFAALWFRSLYGNGRRVALRVALYVAAMATIVAMWPHRDHGAWTSPLVALVAIVPTIVITGTVGHRLAEAIRHRSRATSFDALHIWLGAQLLRTTDAAEIRALGWEAIEQICRWTPGLRVMKVRDLGDVVVVEGRSTGLDDLPDSLPPHVLAALPDSATGPGTWGHRELDAGAGERCAWAGFAAPKIPRRLGTAWLVFGSPDGVPDDVALALDGLSNQIALGYRNSVVHHDLSVQAARDGLTGLANRATFHAVLAAALDNEKAEPVAVLFVDLDDFKDVNDLFGHRDGDTLLREVAARLESATRPDDVCARIGGDEFAVVLPGADVATAKAVADRVVAEIARPASLNGRVVQLGISVGVATASAGLDIEELVHRADVAMYGAKADHTSSVHVFDDTFEAGHVARLAFEQELAQAVHTGQLEVHYQPVVEPDGGECTAVEALVRWRHPERGLQSPDSFIPAAERIGAIAAIGTFVLWQACADAARWRAVDPSRVLAVHVNVSALQLDDDVFIDEVVRCLQVFAWPPEKLVLEFTETVMISSPAAIERLFAISGHGVTIAIDDFGTGYSSLTTLRALPVQIVKIDKSFVLGATTNREDRAVTEAIITMAHQMGVRTIAEGVETRDHEQLLSELGADGLQGYLYLEPAAAGEFGAWLENGAAGR
ncbi:bifunctional diguanylate cyclase/phosphodiesterase [Cellulomonas sp. P24]|uniref:putative bifunctional diguanylate cyclase/phosphodiesterase n=1 Tax=Cellulomonas sp. P24 TaxID=2885206 RepID=UPI00216AD5C5|nr:bifunctional diguanylate cyclase/phosphodiesterase [Cellulomonas sp. P24]MCR6491875.1 bifunctional diguanylate cyclase/phosphodiesterase [Cellulomonas sp. P24]